MKLTSLQKAVIEQLGHDPATFGNDDDECYGTLEDACNHGAAGGFVGFTYYSDTCEFFHDNKAAIIAMAKEQAADFGQDVIGFVASFQCLKDYCNDVDGMDEIGRAVYGRPAKDDTQVQNALAWYALEEVARQLTDN